MLICIDASRQAAGVTDGNHTIGLHPYTPSRTMSQKDPFGRPMAASAAGQLPVERSPTHASPVTQKILAQPTMLIGVPPFGQSADAEAEADAVVLAMDDDGVGVLVVGVADEGLGALVVGSGVTAGVDVVTDCEFEILQP